MKIDSSNWKLRHRILLLVAVLVTATLVSTLALVEFLVREHMQRQVQSHLERSLSSVAKRDHEQGQALQVMLSALSSDPRLSNLLRSGKYTQLVDFLRETTEPYQVVILTNVQGRLLLRSNQQPPAKLEPGPDLTSVGPIRDALKGQTSQGYGWFEGGLWRLASLPLKIDVHGYPGTLTLGYRVEQNMVERSSLESDCEAALVANGSLLAYNQGCPIPASVLLENIQARLPRPDQPQAARELLRFQLEYGSNHYLGALYPLGNPQQPLAYLGLLQGNEDALRLIGQTRWTVGCLGVAALLAALVLSIPVIGRVANPAELLETVVETLGDGLVHFERQGAMLRLNPAAESFLQLQSEQWPGKNFFGSLMLFDREHRLLTPEELQAALDNGVLIRHDEGWIRSVLNDREFASSFVLAPVLEEERCSGGVLLFRDSSQIVALQSQLRELSRHAGMAEVATGTLHNVGNALNSVNVSAGLIAEQLQKSQLPALSKALSLLDREADQLAHFLTQDPKGKKVPSLIGKLFAKVQQQREEVLAELATLRGYVDHVKQVIKAQQDFTRVSGVEEVCDPSQLLEEALSISLASYPTPDLEIVRDFSAPTSARLNKHKVLQILINFCSNALESLNAQQPPRQVTLRSGLESQFLFLEVADNGRGFSGEEHTRLFTHGYTTKPQGHGFGLHNSALAAQELGGKTTAQSPGLGEGAIFRLELPIQGA